MRGRTGLAAQHRPSRGPHATYTLRAAPPDCPLISRDRTAGQACNPSLRQGRRQAGPSYAVRGVATSCMPCLVALAIASLWRARLCVRCVKATCSQVAGADDLI